MAEKQPQPRAPKNNKRRQKKTLSEAPSAAPSPSQPSSNHTPTTTDGAQQQQSTPSTTPSTALPFKPILRRWVHIPDVTQFMPQGPITTLKVIPPLCGEPRRKSPEPNSAGPSQPSRSLQDLDYEELQELLEPEAICNNTCRCANSFVSVSPPTKILNRHLPITFLHVCDPILRSCEADIYLFSYKLMLDWGSLFHEMGSNTYAFYAWAEDGNGCGYFMAEKKIVKGAERGNVYWLGTDEEEVKGILEKGAMGIRDGKRVMDRFECRGFCVEI